MPAELTAHPPTAMSNGARPGAGAPRRPTASRRLALCLLYGLTARHVLLIFMLYPGINGFPVAMFPDLIYGRAYRPFVKRLLLPLIVRTLTALTPKAAQNYIATTVVREFFGGMTVRMGWEPAYFFEYVTAALLMFGCFVGLAYVLRALIPIFYSWPAFVADLAPLGALLLLPLFFRYYSYIYDPPALFLFTLGVLVIATRRHALYYAVLTFATLNKETAILLVPLFLVYEYKVQSARCLALHALAQVSLWLALQFLIDRYCQKSPGADVGYHWQQHNLLILLPPPVFILGVTMILGALVSYQWRAKPLFLRQGLGLTLIPLMLLTAVWGYLDELRDYYEAFVFIFLLALPPVVNALDLPGPAQNAPGPQAEILR